MWSSSISINCKISYAFKYLHDNGTSTITDVFTESFWLIEKTRRKLSRRLLAMECQKTQNYTGCIWSEPVWTLQKRLDEISYASHGDDVSTILRNDVPKIPIQIPS